jgi:hypothetical protein
MVEINKIASGYRLQATSYDQLLCSFASFAALREISGFFSRKETKRAKSAKN